MEEYLWYLLGGGGVGIAGGIGLLVAARKADEENYIIEKATPLPLSLINVRDDVWLKGTAECEAPVSSPYFGYSSLHYLYTLEELVTETYRDSKGDLKTRTTWKERERKKDSAVFSLVQGDLSIEIDGRQAEFRHLKRDCTTLGIWRHTVHYYPYPSEVNAIGSVGEKKECLEAYANIPLIVTSLDRKEFIEDAESSESWMRGGGFIFFFAGMVAFFYGIFDINSYPMETGSKFQWPTLLYSIALSGGISFCNWVMYMYNTFVTYNMRVESSWRQVDVDLKMRYDLIPNLVSVVKGHMEYEKDMLEGLTKMRNNVLAGGRDDKIEMENEVAKSVNIVIARSEKYPDLKSQPSIQKLMRELKAIEEKIAHGRNVYNEAVNEYNINVLSMPRGIIAGLCGFKTRKFFEAVEAEKKAIKLKME